ncbi:MAG: hypothetical protein MN733_16205, partial [Nitrososphaera sp.]|nr:hypothetical protein [Nitrososphaera sp.]
MERGDERKVRILFLAANPNDTSRLRLGEEFKRIDSELQQSRYRDHFELVQMHAVSVGDLQELLLRFQPDIVHFSGHGSEEGALIFEHKSGFSEELPTDALSDLFSIVNRQNKIRCVVLDACYSESQARTIGNHVDCVIGMSKAVTERAATLFSASFYRALGFGNNIKDAFDLGRNELKLQSIGEEQIPIMHSRPGIHAEKILLVNPKIHTTRTSPVKHRDGSIRKEILIAIIAGPLATIIAISWPAIAGYVDEMNQSGIIPIAVAEDCEPFSPQDVEAEQVGQDWKIVDTGSGFEILDFKANELNAEKGVQVIKAYGFNKICFVGRPYNPLNNPVLPMMYFLTNGTAAREIPIEQDCKQLNPQAVSAQRVGDNWLVLDSNVRIYDFGAGQKSKENAERGAQLIKSYGFNKMCFVERPFQPMTYFIISEDRVGSSGNAASFILYLAGKQIIVDGKDTGGLSTGGKVAVLDGPELDCGPDNSTTALPDNSTLATPENLDFGFSIDSPAENEPIPNHQVLVSGHANAALGVSSVRVRVGSEDPMDATPRAANDWSLWEANISVSNDGTHRVVATAFDAACNWDKDSRYFDFDAHPPNVTVTSHTSGEMVRASTITLSGTVTDYPFSGVQWVKVQVD